MPQKGYLDHLIFTGTTQWLPSLIICMARIGEVLKIWVKDIV